MRITLEPPFNNLWRLGYTVVNKEDRKMVCLFNSSKDRTTISFARYLISIKENRILAKDEQVDHINEDKTDDSIENLQILSQKQNHNKTFKKGETKKTFICPICGISFLLVLRQSHKQFPTCSRKCGGIKSHKTKANKFLKDNYADIR